jgi:hypothetical protein
MRALLTGELAQPQRTGPSQGENPESSGSLPCGRAQITCSWLGTGGRTGDQIDAIMAVLRAQHAGLVAIVRDRNRAIAPQRRRQLPR